MAVVVLMKASPLLTLRFAAVVVGRAAIDGNRCACWEALFGEPCSHPPHGFP